MHLAGPVRLLIVVDIWINFPENIWGYISKNCAISIPKFPTIFIVYSFTEIVKIARELRDR